MQGATSGDSAVYRVPKPGTQLYREMLAATPLTYLEGYRRAIERAIPPRSASIVRPLLGHVHGRRVPLSAREVTCRRTVISAGARAAPGSRTSTPRARAATSNSPMRIPP
jgi:hypothetical protein